MTLRMIFMVLSMSCPATVMMFNRKHAGARLPPILIRAEYGSAPVIQFNEHHRGKTGFPKGTIRMLRIVTT